MRRAALAATLLLSSAFAGRAAADIMQYESLDLAVARADLVVRGEVVELTSKKLENGIVWSRVTVKVAETIKGDKVKEVTFLVRSSPFELRRAAWASMTEELLVCLNTFGGKMPEESPLKGDYFLRDGNVSWAVALSGTAGPRPVYGPDFKELTDPKETLAAARAAAGLKAGKAELGWIDESRLRPCEVLYPDTAKVRGAATKAGLKLREIR